MQINIAGGRRIAIAAAVVIAAMSAGLTLSLVTRGAPVTVVCDGRAVRLERSVGTVEDALKAAGIALEPGDEVSPGLSARAGPGTLVVVNRAVPVSISVDGRRIEGRVAATLVRDALAQSGVALSDGDLVNPPLEAEVAPGMAVGVVRLTEEVVTKKVTVPFQTERREDPALEIGLSRVLQKGRNGVKEVVVRLLKRGAQVISSKTISERLLERPVPQVVAMGTAGVVSRGGQTIRFRKALEVIATAYTPGPESTGLSADGYTATGLRAGYGIVAVDPRVIPLGSRLYVDGYGFAVAGDVGGAIKGSRIDVCFESKAEALRWGRRKTKVFVL